LSLVSAGVASLPEFILRDGSVNLNLVKRLRRLIDGKVRKSLLKHRGRWESPKPSHSMCYSEICRPVTAERLARVIGGDPINSRADADDIMSLILPDLKGE